MANVVEERLRTERAFHERQTTARAAHFAVHPDGWLVDDEEYLDHESWIRLAMESLGDVAGRDVLDYGCGHGMASVVLARRGARVTAFDLAAGYVRETTLRAAANGVARQVAALEGAAERLPFRDQSFDAVWGNAVLHHVDLDLALAELRRVLKPGGRGVFCEPWGGNSLLQLARRHLPYPGKERSSDERPLCRADVERIRQCFPALDVRPCQFLSMARRLVGAGRLTARLNALDERLFQFFPSLGRYSRYVVLSFQNEPLL